MATAITQSEWMTHFVGKPMPQADRVFCLDSSRGPIIFFVDTAGQLQVLKADAGGGTDVLNLCDLWGLSGTVTSVAASQDDQGLIYMAFVKAKSDNEMADSVYAMAPLTVDQLTSNIAWKNALIQFSPGQDINAVSVTSVLMGNGRGSRGYPETLVVYNLANSVVAVARIIINLSNQTFNYGKCPLPSIPDPGSVIKAVPGIITTDPGIFFYYMVQKKPFLTFVPFTDNGVFPISPTIVCDPDVTSLQTSVNSNGLTDLVVGSPTGIRWYSADALKFSGATGSLVLSGSITHCRVASSPDSNYSTTWAVLGASTLGYIKIDNNGVLLSPWTPVANGDFARVSPSMNVSGSLERIVFCDSTQTVRLLEQTSAGIWNNHMLTVPEPQQINTNICYVAHIKISCDQMSQAANRQFKLTCSSSSTVLVNDQILTVDAAGVLVKTDSGGKLEVINLTQSLETPTFFLADPPHAPAFLATSPVMLDPALKVKATLATSTTATQLSDLTAGPTGGKIFPPTTDFDHLSSTLTSISTQIGTLPSNGSSKPPPANNDSQHWGLFHYVREAAQEASDALHSFEMDAEHFIITVGGKIYKFFVDCHEQALKAVATVLSATGAALKDLQHWLGYVFNWDDILVTQKSFVSMITFAGSLTDEVIDNGFGALDECLVQVKAKVTGYAIPNNSTTSVNTTKSSLQSQQDPTVLASEKSDPKTSHTAIDYIVQKLKGVSSSDATQLGDDNGIDSNFWSKEVPSILATIDTQFKIIHDDIAAIFQSGGTASISDCFAKLGGDILATIIEAVRTILAGLKDAFKIMFRSFFNTAQTRVYIPFISALWKWLTKTDDDPMLADICMLVAAVPCTILCKLAGKQIPVFTTEKFIELFPNATTLSKATTGTNSKAIPRKETSLQSATDTNIWWDFYNTLSDDLLTPFSQAQPWVCAGINMIYAYFTTVDIVSPWDESGIAAPSTFEYFENHFKIFNQALSVLIISPGQWDQTSTPGLRFMEYGIEWVFVILDVSSQWALRKKFVTEREVSVISMVGATLVFVEQEIIAIEETTFAFTGDKTASAWSSDQTTMRQTAAKWWAGELVASYVANMMDPAASLIEDPDSKLICAGVNFFAGEATQVSQMLRSVYVGDGFDTFPVTT